jgi:hypothetical protein
MERVLGDDYRQVVVKKRRPNTSRLGRSLEWKVRRLLVAAGYKVQRSAASKGVADLVAFRRDGNLLVQVKRGGSFSPGPWNEMFELAEEGRLAAILVTSPLGEDLYWFRLTGPKDGSSHQQPMETWAIPERSMG